MCGTLPADAQDPDRLLFYDDNGLKLRGHFQSGLNAVAENNLFWDLAATTAPGNGFDPDTEWLEGYIKPGLSFEYQPEAGPVVYGKLSAVSSYTWGTDAFDTGDTGATTLEEAYLAIRSDLSTSLAYDLSLGPRELTLGSGMLIASGAASGFERGALKFGPREAWEMAAIGRLLRETYRDRLLPRPERTALHGRQQRAGRLRPALRRPAGRLSRNHIRERARVRITLSAGWAGWGGGAKGDPGCPRGDQHVERLCQDEPGRGRLGELDLHGAMSRINGTMLLTSRLGPGA
jgi:hypothetical protein